MPAAYWNGKPFDYYSARYSSFRNREFLRGDYRPIYETNPKAHEENKRDEYNRAREWDQY